MKMHVRTEKTTAVSRTARHTDRSVGYSVRRGYAEHKREAHPRDRARPVAGPTRRANGNPHSSVVVYSGLKKLSNEHTRLAKRAVRKDEHKHSYNPILLRALAREGARDAAQLRRLLP